MRAINAEKGLAKKTLSDEKFMENMTDWGAELTGFFRNRSIVKMVEWIGLSYGNRTREYYLKNSVLFFVVEKFESFVVNDTAIDHSRVKTTFQGRYYFNKGKLLEKKLTGKRTFDNGFAGIEQELIHDAKDNIKLLNAN